MKYYDNKLERLILRALLSVDGFVEKVVRNSQFGDGVFADITNKTVYKAIVTYYQENSSVPNESLLNEYIIRELNNEGSDSKKLPRETLIKNYNILVERLFERKTVEKEKGTLTPALETLIMYKRARMVQEKIITANDFVDQGKVELAENALFDYKLEFGSIADYADEGDYVKDWYERLKLIQQKKKHPELFSAIPSGIYGWNPNDPFEDSNWVALDTFLDGGHYKGDITLIIGDSGAGKSFELMELAYNAALSGKNVVLFSIEMNKWQVQTRLDARISGIPFRKFRMATLTKKDVLRWRAAVDQFQRKAGKLRIVGFTKGCTVSSIEIKIKEIEQRLGYKVDLLVVDYLNDISPDRNFAADKDWQEQGDISLSMKRLAASWDDGEGIPIITANQGKSASSLGKFKSSGIGLPEFKMMSWQDAAFSPLPSQHSAVIMGLLHSKEETNNFVSIMNHQVIKNRYGISSMGIVTFPRLEVCRINSRKSYQDAAEKFDEIKDESENENDL